jgi:beta-glucosidase
VNLIRLDSSLGCPYLQPDAPALALPAAAALRPCLVDGQGPSPWSGDREAPLALERLGEGPVLLQRFVRGNPFRGRADGADPWPAAIRQLQAAGRLAGLAVYGSPYAWEALEPLLDPDVPAAWCAGQMPLAQGELLGRLGFGTPGTGGPAARDFTD